MSKRPHIKSRPQFLNILVFNLVFPWNFYCLYQGNDIVAFNIFFPDFYTILLANFLWSSNLYWCGFVYDICRSPFMIELLKLHSLLILITNTWDHVRMYALVLCMMVLTYGISMGHCISILKQVNPCMFYSMASMLDTMIVLIQSSFPDQK